MATFGVGSPVERADHCWPSHPGTLHALIQAKLIHCAWMFAADTGRRLRHQRACRMQFSFLCWILHAFLLKTQSWFSYPPLPLLFSFPPLCSVPAQKLNSSQLSSGSALYSVPALGATKPAASPLEKASLLGGVKAVCMGSSSVLQH